jgi:signal transduction histidine kinase
MDERFSADVESAAFRIVQEALTNVVRHACASRCQISLICRDGRLQLAVQDDGAGFNPEAQDGLDASRRGLGLVGIRERASHLGGTVRVDSAPGRGTRLTCELPGRAGPVVSDADEPGAADAARALSRPEVLRG